jgi:hypothetical protein
MRAGAPLLILLLAGRPALAQDTPEARLRDMLRRTTADLRAAQDSQATLQAKLDQETGKNALLHKQVEDLQARVATPAKPSISDDDIARLQANLHDAQARIAMLEPGVKQWQDAYQKAADVARSKDAESKSASTRAADAEKKVGICTAANTKLIAVSNDILHLYQTQSFRSLLLSSYEPVLGLKKVELENTIQDYEDKILDQKYRPGQDAAKAATTQ